jgi:hypothetical protein
MMAVMVTMTTMSNGDDAHRLLTRCVTARHEMNDVDDNSGIGDAHIQHARISTHTVTGMMSALHRAQ